MTAQRSGWLTAVALSMLALPLAVLGLRAPLWLGVLIAALALALAALAMRAPARAAPRIALKLGVLEEAETALHAIADHAHAVRDARLRASLGGVAASARRLIDHVAAQPADLGRMQRALTYYIPRAATLATSAAVMEDAGEFGRLADVARVLARIEAYLAKSLDWTTGDARRTLDVELKLIDDALDEDLSP